MSPGRTTRCPTATQGARSQRSTRTVSRTSTARCSGTGARRNGKTASTSASTRRHRPCAACRAGHPTRNGWYNKPVTVSFAGTDATSGMAGCSAATYSGPDKATAVVSGSCKDKAGNVGAASVHLAYDSTPPPPVGDVNHQALGQGRSPELEGFGRHKDGASDSVGRQGGAQARLQRVGSSYRDQALRPGAKYKYTFTAFDAASNSTAETAAVTATGRLVAPFPGESVTSPPRLSWVPVKGASYYNVQLIKNHRVLSAWPARANFKVPVHWKYRGTITGSGTASTAGTSGPGTGSAPRRSTGACSAAAPSATPARASTERRRRRARRGRAPRAPRAGTPTR
jgi:hypothetical protein